MRTFFLGFTLLVAALAPRCGAAPAVLSPRSELLILISIDAFRWDYMQKYSAPVLSRLAADGVHARRMTSSFPSVTFPNHYTIVTGLWPEHHGIVANTFYDPDLRAKFNYTNHACSVDPRWWSSGEPIWITAEKHGERSACFFWPGSEAENHGLKPTFSKPFDKHLTPDQRVDGLRLWLALPPAQRPRFATLYFNIVDTVGHEAGPDSPKTGAAVATVDAAIGRLLDGLAKLGLRDHTDLVLVSDHGMTAVSPARTLFLDDFVKLDSIGVDFIGPNAGLRPKTGTPAELAAKFRGKSPHLSVWLRDEVPERFHYRASNNIAPVILSADPGWLITTHAFLQSMGAKFEHGAHGYDPATSDMGALFIADGPSFRHGVEFADVSNIDVYNLLCAALDLKPAPNDGDDELVRETMAR